MLSHALSTEARTVPRCEHGRHPPSLDGELGPSDGIDTAVDHMEPPDADAMPDCFERVTELEQLRLGDYAKLSRDQLPGRSRALAKEKWGHKGFERARFTPFGAPL